MGKPPLELFERGVARQGRAVWGPTWNPRVGMKIILN